MKREKYSDAFLSEKYKLVVLDMDGTLYYQRSMQLLMCLEMGVYGLIHPFSLWKFRVISDFRKVREREEYAKAGKENMGGEEEDLQISSHNLLKKQYEITAVKTKKSVKQVQDCIEEWMFYRPLKYLSKVKDGKLLEWIKYWKEHGVKVVVFSDYPAEEKCRALAIEGVGVYSSEEGRIGEMKPSIKGLSVICKEFNVAYHQVLVVGDRMSRDGKMAENAGADYVILKKYKWMRNRYY